MSWLEIIGLRVECPKCGAVRRIPRAAGPRDEAVGDLMQVGDQNMVLMPRLWSRTGDPADQYHFFIYGICGTCAAPDLASPAKDLLEQALPLLDEIHTWAREQMHVGRRVLSQSEVLAPAIHDDAWLQRVFPELWRQCFEEGKCRLHPDHRIKMRKRFRIHVLREIDKEGVPLTESLRESVAAATPGHPFQARLEATDKAARSLTSRRLGPYRILRAVHLAEGLNLNPVLRYEHTVFFAGNTPIDPFYEEFEFIPEDLVNFMTGALREGADPERFRKDPELVEQLRQGVLQATEAWQK